MLTSDIWSRLTCVPSCVTVVFSVLKLNTQAIKSTNESLCLRSATIAVRCVCCVQIDGNEKASKINYSGDNNIDRRRTLDSLSSLLFVRVCVVFAAVLSGATYFNRLTLFLPCILFRLVLQHKFVVACCCYFHMKSTENTKHQCLL